MDQDTTNPVPDDTYHLTELIHIHSRLAKACLDGRAKKLLDAKDKIEDLILKMVSDMSYN